MEKEVKIMAIVKYSGHGIGQNGNINLTLKAEYGELVNMMQLAQMLNNDVSVKVKMPEENPFKLGFFRIKSLNIAGDGETTLKLNSLSDFVEVGNLNRLIASERFAAKFESLVEIEDED